MESTPHSSKNLGAEPRHRMKGKLSSKQSTLPPSSSPPRNNHLHTNRIVEAQAEYDDAPHFEVPNDDPFGFLASERKLNVLKSQKKMDVIINAKPVPKAMKPIASKGKTSGKENSGVRQQTAASAGTHHPSSKSSASSELSPHRSSSVPVRSPLKDKMRGHPPDELHSDSSKEDDSACSSDTDHDSESQHSSAGGSEDHPRGDGDEDHDVTIRSLRSRDVLASKADESTPKPTKVKKRRAPRNKRATTSNTKSKKISKPLSEESELDDLEDDIREKYLSERQTRQEYFKRLESYEVAKEKVYII
ncbi:hypothetical protein SCHPADRAFT_997928 [Schizopora paradoxa]|uniref:Uncharacterized protein n=1 Tax=Schizopora paradoxa TaxID=27342 RepID=A0A0H2RM81_9AGAM|nr:hypothetical protein SCHPADRAFT_997928 [Schizopora paradoxa]